MKLQNSSQKEYKLRQAQLQEKLAAWNTDGCLIENPVDINYLLGLQLSLGSLIVTRKELILLVDGRYFQVAQSIPGIKVLLLSDKEFKGQLTKKLVIDSAFTSADRYLALNKLCALQPIPQLLKELRAVKSSDEQKFIKQSAELLQKGFAHIQKKLKTGISERELALEFEYFCKKQGAEKLAFDSIIAFGANSAMPHYRSADARLKKNDIVLVDIGVVVNNYHSDMTRVLFFGNPNPFLSEMLAIVKDAQKAALKLCKPGATCGQLDQAARAVMKEKGVEEHFIHSLGHGIGLQTHEYPRLKSTGEDKDTVLKAGMVITIEPGLYFPGKGGLRYEDMILITPKGHKKITTC